MSDPIRFSVITPTHNRSRSLLLMLEALSEQDYPTDCFEVIVIVDGRDSTVWQDLGRQRYPFELRAIQASATGPAAARNDGLHVAHGQYVLFLDDDVLPAPALIRRHAERHREADVVVIGPLLASASPRPRAWTRWEWATLQDQYHAMEAGRWEITPRQFYTGNASVRRDHVSAVGGFNPLFRRGEDVELAWRLHNLGLPFVFEPLAEAEHLAERSYDAWLYAAFEYGRTDVMLERIRTGRSLPGWVQREFRSRHPFTRLLAQLVLAQAALWRPMPAGGRLAIEVAERIRMRRVAHRLCSALFTAAYWRGVSDQLGASEALALTRRPPPIHTAEPAT